MSLYRPHCAARGCTRPRLAMGPLCWWCQQQAEKGPHKP